MDIKEKFLELTTRTYPIGTEKEVYKFLPEDFKKDQFDNLYHVIGESDILFCSHLDTVGPATSVPVSHVVDGDIIKTDGKTILGADDKAGVVIMLQMIEKNIPGTYYFFYGEEKGCKGSSQVSQKIQDSKNDKLKGIRKVIAFDRMGYDSIITHQMEQRCCSDEFGDALANELNKNGFNYSLDTTGMYSDSAEFADIFSECTNISVGYFNQHRIDEYQNIDFLKKLADTCCKINWAALPAVRDPKRIEYVDSYYYGKKKKRVEDIKDEDNIDDYNFHPFEIEDSKDVQVFYFKDKKFDFISDISYLNDEIIDITLCKKRCEKELNDICDYLEKMDMYYDSAWWDGLILKIGHDKHETKMSRNELLKYIPELDIEKIKS